MLLCFLFIGCYAVSNEISRFLNENGFGNLKPRFVDQEVEVRQIPAMPDHLLVELGVRTIGSRLRIRSAASHWLENQVFLLLILILFVFLLCCQFLLQQGEEQGGEVDGDAGEPLGDGDVDEPKEVMGSWEIGEQVMEVSG